MLHNFFAPRPWFAPKRFGYGAGWPTARQGWALLALYFGTLGGIGLLAQRPDGASRTLALTAILLCTAIFITIARKRTGGGWRWRWGD
jgi:hypothetical protein